MTLARIAANTFDYSALRVADAGAVQEAADRIRKLNTDVKNTMIAAGRELLAVKQILRHGDFGKWLSAEFDMAERTARRYMRAAEWADGKSDIVAVLDQTAIYELASAPPEVTQDIVTLIGAGHRPSIDLVRMKATEARAACKRARLAEERNRRRRQPTPSELTRQSRQAARAEREAEADRRREADRDQLAAAAVDVLMEAPDAQLVLRALEAASHLVIDKLRKRLGGGE